MDKLKGKLKVGDIVMLGKDFMVGCTVRPVKGKKAEVDIINDVIDTFRVKVTDNEGDTHLLYCEIQDLDSYQFCSGCEHVKVNVFAEPCKNCDRVNRNNWSPRLYPKEYTFYEVCDYLTTVDVDATFERRIHEGATDRLLITKNCTLINSMGSVVFKESRNTGIYITEALLADVYVRVNKKKRYKQVTFQQAVQSGKPFRPLGGFVLTSQDTTGALNKNGFAKTFSRYISLAYKYIGMVTLNESMDDMWEIEEEEEVID